MGGKSASWRGKKHPGSTICSSTSGWVNNAPVSPGVSTIHSSTSAWVSYAPVSLGVFFMPLIWFLVSPGCSLEGLMLKLKLQYFDHLMWRPDSFKKTLMLGKIEGRSRRGWQRMRCWMASQTQLTWVWVDSGSWWWTGRLGMLWFMGSQRVGHDWATELTELSIHCEMVFPFIKQA